VARLIALVVIAFNVWMFVDAFRRRAETYWLWVIMMVPWGSLLYFVLVRARDREAQLLGRRLLAGFKRPPSIEKLQRQRDESPSIANRLRYAQGLTDARHFEEAKAEFENVLAERPTERDALFGKAVCEIELGAPDRAIEPLTRILDEAPTYNDFAAYPELAQALFATGQVEACLDLLRGLVKSHPRIGHVVLLARYLEKTGDRSTAQSELELAHRHYDDAPQHYRRENRAFARKARAMLEELEQPKKPTRS
jgi:hypothetical protein